MDDNISTVLTEIKTHIGYIRQDIKDMKPVIKAHDEAIRDAKTSINILKLLGGVGTALAAFFGFGGHHG